MFLALLYLLFISLIAWCIDTAMISSSMRYPSTSADTVNFLMTHAPLAEDLQDRLAEGEIIFVPDDDWIDLLNG